MVNLKTSQLEKRRIIISMKDMRKKSSNLVSILRNETDILQNISPSSRLMISVPAQILNLRAGAISKAKASFSVVIRKDFEHYNSKGRKKQTWKKADDDCKTHLEAVTSDHREGVDDPLPLGTEDLASSEIEDPSWEDFGEEDQDSEEEIEGWETLGQRFEERFQVGRGIGILKKITNLHILIG